MQFLSFGLVSSVAIAIVLIVVLTKAVKFVPQNRAFVVERFGKYTRTLEAGLNFLNPFFDRVAYNRTLKEQAVDVPSQAAITRDNISLIVDGVLYLKVLDPYKPSSVFAAAPTLLRASAFASATAIIAFASPSAFKICSAFSASAASTRACFSPSATLIDD